jgi:hypothetical protein
MRRPVLAALVATLLLLLGSGVAAAAWRTTNTGTATAKAGQIGTPSGITIGTITCTGSGLTANAVIPVSWNAVTGATGYTVESSRALGLGSQTQTVADTSTTITTPALLGNITVRVTAKAGNWVGSTSAAVTRAVTCPSGSGGR